MTTLLAEAFEMGALNDVRLAGLEPLLGLHRFELITLHFDYGLIVIGVNADDDTITISDAKRELSGEEAVILAAQRQPWRDLLGLRLMNSWLMRNQRGYVDSIQLEFSLPGAETTRTVQLVAMASLLYAYAVTSALNFPAIRLVPDSGS